jgi:hypothetical protein
MSTQAGSSSKKAPRTRRSHMENLQILVAFFSIQTPVTLSREPRPAGKKSNKRQEKRTSAMFGNIRGAAEPMDGANTVNNPMSAEIFAASAESTVVSEAAPSNVSDRPVGRSRLGFHL